MSFYVTLWSDASLNYYPNKTLSHFAIQSSEPIQLEGEWEISLMEICYPENNIFWYDVPHECYFRFSVDGLTS